MFQTCLSAVALFYLSPSCSCMLGTYGPLLPDHIWHHRPEDDIPAVPFPGWPRGSSWWTLSAVNTEQTRPGAEHFTVHAHILCAASFQRSCVVTFDIVIFFTSRPNQLQSGRLFPDQAEVWMGRWAGREGSGSSLTCPEAVGVVASPEGQRETWSLGLPRVRAWWELEERSKSLCLHTSPGRPPTWASLRAKHWALTRPSCIASTAVVSGVTGWTEVTQ